MSLAVVIPVFNEQMTIAPLINDLHQLLNSENISHQFIIVNDGSTDNSLAILYSLGSSVCNMQVITHQNCGHGPSLLIGYNLALQYDWVFQLDSDYQYDLATFHVLWKQKEKYDLLVAERAQRNSSIARDVATFISQVLVKSLYGSGLKDVNSPYRLMRSEKLRPALKKIKAGSFAPNILVSAYFLKNKFSVFTTQAESLQQSNERKSKMNKYMLKGCLKSFSDSFLFRFKI